jgi:Homing endonuclease
VSTCRSCASGAGDYPEGTGCGDQQAIDVLGWARDAAGYEPDPWQEWFLTNALGTLPDATWAATDIGLVVSRQNGKGTVLEIRELGGLFVLGEELIIHTAHEFKDLCVRTPVLTANRGWSTMGELVTGDLAYAPDGTATRLTAHPWLHDSDCYTVTFADGQQVIAGAGHLWDVTEAWLHNGKTEHKVVTTRQMLDAGLVHESKGTPGGRRRRVWRWRVALPEPFAGAHQDFPVDPWLLGLWLGDGSTGKGEVSVGQQDLEYVTGCLADLGELYRLRQDKRTGVWTAIISGLRSRLGDLGVLSSKSVPAAYLTASVPQRRRLLAGIMDSDGTVSGHQLAVTMIREPLMRQVLQLVRGLGYRATFREFRASLNGADAGPMYRVQFAPNGASPFLMPRKTAKIRQLKTSRSAYNAVVSIEPAATCPTRCITVDHPSGCYLAGDGFLVTHNTGAEHFRRVKTTLDNYPALRKRVKRVSTSHGEEAIELHPQPTLIFGSGRRQITRRVAGRLRFLARSKGSGLGFSCDCLVYDEAMILTEDQVAASLPTMSARANPQIWYTGSAGREDSFQFASIRSRIVANSCDLCGAEWSIDPHNDGCTRDELSGRELNMFVTCTRHDDRDVPVSWAKANPGYGYRITEKFTRDVELKGMPPRKFDRERLGVGDWPQPEAPWSVVSEIAWQKLAVSAKEAGFATPPIVFGIDIDEDGRSATISAAWDHAGSHRVVLEVPRGCSRQGSDWVLDRAHELYRKHSPLRMVLPRSGPAAALIPGAEKLWRDRLETLGTAEEAAAFAWFLQETRAEHLWHFGRDGAPTIWHAVSTASTRVVGDGGKAWSRRDSESDITPVTSATAAAYVLNKYRRSYDLLSSVA